MSSTLDQGWPFSRRRKDGIALSSISPGWDGLVITIPIRALFLTTRQNNCSRPSRLRFLIAGRKQSFTRNGQGRARWEILPFDAFYSSQVGHISDYKTAEQFFRKAARALLSKTGAAYLVTHSQSGPLGWHVADECPDLVNLKSFLTEPWYG
jgi:hypothetical protein